MMTKRAGGFRSASDRLSVVLVAPRNPLNIGAAARAMSNFGFHRLRVVNPYEMAFREAKSARGAADLLRNAEEFGSVSAAVADCSLVVGTTAARNRRLEHELWPLAEGARRIRDELRWGSAALLFGSEKRGLSNQDLSYCRWLLRIPTCEEQPSMNLGQAVALCLYELAQPAEVGAGRQPRPAATAAETERLASILLEVLRASGYFESSAGLNEQKIRRLAYRLGLGREDAQLWLGMLRQILWKMRRAG
jgi:TrmH family RNA methyltransferase